MNLPNPKELDSILKVLRKHGVLQYQSSELNLVLSETPPTKIKHRTEEDLMEEIPPEEDIERLVNWSSQHPVESLPEE